MQILINHVTRMKPGYVCVAGLTQDGSHLRPVAGRLPRAVVSTAGGPFDLCSIVDVGTTIPCGAAPEVEDHRFVPAQARMVRLVNGPTFWQTLDLTSHDSLRQIFGPSLTNRRRGATVDPGEGLASLGVLRPSGPVSITQGSPNSVRISFSDVDLGQLNLSLTDLRFVDESQQQVDQKSLEEARRRLRRAESVLLSVGLSRAWPAPGDTGERHWLQVNNVHFEDYADWRLKLG